MYTELSETTARDGRDKGGSKKPTMAGLFIDLQLSPGDHVLDELSARF
jgi:hypothetical protein